jgi:hypothetical protein
MPNVPHVTLPTEQIVNMLEQARVQGMTPDASGLLFSYYKQVRRSRVEMNDINAMRPWIAPFLKARLSKHVSSSPQGFPGQAKLPTFRRPQTQEIHNLNGSFHFRKGCFVVALQRFFAKHGMGSKRFRKLVVRDNVEALARMFDNLRFSLQKNDLSVIELLGLDPNAMPVVHDSPEDSVDNLGQELVTPDRKPKRKGHISIRRRRLFWRTTKRARACKVRAQTPRTSSSKLDLFSDFELSQRTLEPDGMDDCDMLSQVAPTPPKRARLFTQTPAGWNANCSGSAAAMNMVEVEDIEDIVFGPMPAAEPTPAPAVAAEGGSTDSGATAARADSTPAAPASRAEEVEGAKDIEDIRNINTVECIKDVECSGHVSVGTGSFDVEHEGQRDLEKRLADIEVAEYDLMSGVAWIVCEGEKVCAQGLRAAEGEVDMTWASFILDTAMGKWELELEVRDLKWTSVKNKVFPPQGREMSGGSGNC